MSLENAVCGTLRAIPKAFNDFTDVEEIQTILETLRETQKALEAQLRRNEWLDAENRARHGGELVRW